MREINPEISCEYKLLFSAKGSFTSDFKIKLEPPESTDLTIMGIKNVIKIAAERYGYHATSRYLIEAPEGYSDDSTVKRVDDSPNILSFKVTVIPKEREIYDGKRSITRGLLSISKLTASAALFIEYCDITPAHWRNNRFLTYCGIAVGLGSLVRLSMMSWGASQDAYTDKLEVDRYIALASTVTLGLALLGLRHLLEETNLLFKIMGLAAAVELTGIIGTSLLANGFSTKAFKDALNDTKSGYYQGISK